MEQTVKDSDSLEVVYKRLGVRVLRQRLISVKAATYLSLNERRASTDCAYSGREACKEVGIVVSPIPRAHLVVPDLRGEGS